YLALVTGETVEVDQVPHMHQGVGVDVPDSLNGQPVEIPIGEGGLMVSDGDNPAKRTPRRLLEASWDRQLRLGLEFLDDSVCVRLFERNDVLEGDRHLVVLDGLYELVFGPAEPNQR